MLEENHGQFSKQFMQKILMFIDTVLVKAVNSSQEEANKSLIGGIMNVRDALFSEIIKENQKLQISEFLKQEELKKNQEQNQEKDLEFSSQETELGRDQSV